MAVGVARRVGSRIAGYLLAGALVLLCAFTLGSGPAAAGPYPPSQCATVSVSTTTPHSGETMTVSGTGFTAGEQVTVELESTPRDVGSATVQANGTFTAQITIPTDMYGKHQLIVTGGHPSCPVSAITLDIQSSAALGEQIGPNGGGGGGGGALSSTGVQIALLLAIAAVALAAGVALTRAGRQKRSRI